MGAVALAEAAAEKHKGGAMTNTDDNIDRAYAALLAMQAACQHTRISEHPFSIDDKDGVRKHGIIRKCEDCGLRGAALDVFKK